MLGNKMFNFVSVVTFKIVSFNWNRIQDFSPPQHRDQARPAGVDKQSVTFKCHAEFHPPSVGWLGVESYEVVTFL